jgi:hypothetical protein
VSIYKRGEVYWYKFMWQGRMVRESTKQGNDKVARQMEAAHRTSLAKGEVGIRDKKRCLPWPSLARSVLHPGHSPQLAKKRGLTTTDPGFE